MNEKIVRGVFFFIIVGKRIPGYVVQEGRKEKKKKKKEKIREKTEKK